MDAEPPSRPPRGLGSCSVAPILRIRTPTRVSLKVRIAVGRGMGGVSKMGLMVTATWGLLLAESYLFFAIVRPLAPNIHESLFSAAFKVGATIGLVVVWGIVMFVLETYYVRSISLKAG